MDSKYKDGKRYIMQTVTKESLSGYTIPDKIDFKAKIIIKDKRHL